METLNEEMLRETQLEPNGTNLRSVRDPERREDTFVDKTHLQISK